MTYQNQEKTYFKVECSQCGKETELPFKPLDGKKTYCRDCFRKKKQDEN